MKHVDRLFLGSGILLALVGMALGIAMAAQQDFSLAPVHTHVNLVGWVSLALFGLAYRTGLARADRWALIHFVVAVAGAILMPIGIYQAITAHEETLVRLGATLTAASMLLFGVNFLRAGRG